MVYLVGGGSVMGVLFMSLGVSSPLLWSVWFSGLTGMLVYLLLLDGCGGSAAVLYLVEESVSLWVMVLWLGLGGGAGLLVGLFVKGGFVPAHSWFVGVVSSCSSGTLVWGVSFHKSAVVALLSVVGWGSLAGVLIGSLVVGVSLMFSLGDVRSMVVLSSSSTTVLVVLQSGFW